MQTQKDKVIVTGGAGFIGSHLVRRLIKIGYEVHVIDNLSSGKKENVDPEAILHIADVGDLESIRNIFKNAAYVFHMAALPRVQYSIEFPIETHKTNVIGTLNVLIASAENKVRKLIYSASSAAYGDKKDMPINEGAGINPKSPYGMHKYVGEIYSQVWSEVYQLPTVSLRYFNVYGPGQSNDGAYASVIARFLRLKAEGKPLTITGTGEQTRDFVHVSDVVEANILAMQKESLGKGEVINIGSGTSASVNEIANYVGGDKEFVPARLEPMHTVADIRLARELLGWEPKVDLKKGIGELLRA